MSKIQTINVRLPDDIVKWLDSLVDQGIYGSRAEAIRDFLRDYLGGSR
jgi:Arc/MetJ-type ribon-helix-helix transcriptional regulator